jgi:hypothetical protein
MVDGILIFLFCDYFCFWFIRQHSIISYAKVFSKTVPK